ncbi:MAG: hypothetical protein J6M46_06420 [Lachnospiraceae bacterium]|nr:hypothetical protein [Lachnospiraceae bacterium]
MSSESKIVRQIDEIEDYIEGCKYMRFSNDNIVVSKERLASMLEQLRDLTPQEILHYQSIIDRKDEILEDARRKADELMEQATYKFNESLNENAVMQEAYKQADELVRQGANQGQAILNQAIADANNYRSQAAGYVDGMLAEMENLSAATLHEAQEHFEAYLKSVNTYLTTIRANRQELRRSIEAAAAPQQAPAPEVPAEGAQGIQQ